MKKVLSFLSMLFLISFVSAYNPFSLQRVLDSLDPSTAILGSIFIISFAFIFIGLTNWKKLQGQRGIAGIISFVISFVIIYYIHHSGYNYENFYYNIFDNIGLSTNIASTFLPIVLLIAAIFLLVKFGLGWLFIASGLFLFGYGIGFAYETGATAILGGIIALIGIYLQFIKKKTNK